MLTRVYPILVALFAVTSIVRLSAVSSLPNSLPSPLSVAQRTRSVPELAMRSRHSVNRQSEQGGATAIPTTDAALQTDKEALSQQVQELWKVHKDRQFWNNRFNGIFIGIGLVGALIVAFGRTWLQRHKLAGITAFIVAVSVGIPQAYPLGAKSEFYRIVVDEADKLKDALRFSVRDRTDFEKVLAQFSTLRSSAAKDIPKGQDLKAAIDLSVSLALQRAEAKALPRGTTDGKAAVTP